jgi:hypothetical protein
VFKELHAIIQAAIAWQDYHLFEFTIGDKIYGLPGPGWDYGRKIFKAKFAKVATFVDQGTGIIEHVYDMGDNWQRTLRRGY